MGTYNVQTHPEVVFNGQSVDKLPGLFDSSNNRSDVGLIEVGIEGTKKKKTVLINMEINSSPMRFTVSKTICGLIQLYQIVKAHGVHGEVLIGFALPKLHDKAIGVKVEVNFDKSTLLFNVNSTPFKPSEFDTELQGDYYQPTHARKMSTFTCVL